MGYETGLRSIDGALRGRIEWLCKWAIVMMAALTAIISINNLRQRWHLEQAQVIHRDRFVERDGECITKYPTFIEVPVCQLIKIPSLMKDAGARKLICNTAIQVEFDSWFIISLLNNLVSGQPTNDPCNVSDNLIIKVDWLLSGKYNPAAWVGCFLEASPFLCPPHVIMFVANRIGHYCGGHFGCRFMANVLCRNLKVKSTDTIVKPTFNPFCYRYSDFKPGALFIPHLGKSIFSSVSLPPTLLPASDGKTGSYASSYSSDKDEPKRTNSYLLLKGVMLSIIGVCIVSITMGWRMLSPFFDIFICLIGCAAIIYGIALAFG